MTELQIETGSVYSQRFEAAVADGNVGAKISLEFQPAAFKIKNVVTDYQPGTRAIFHLVQIAKEIGGGQADPSQAKQGNIGYAERCVPADKPHAGWAIDVDLITKKPISEAYKAIAQARAAELANPPEGPEAKDYEEQLAVDTMILGGNCPATGVLTSLDYRYSQQRLQETIPLFTEKKEQTTGNALVMTDWRAPAGQNRATLRDNPGVPIGNPILGMDFETAILLQYESTSGPKNRYLAVVSWGWRRSAGKSDVKLADIALLKQPGLTDEFEAARVHWNGLTVADPEHPDAAARPVLTMPGHDA